MTANGWVQIVLFFGVVLALTVPTGAFLHKVMEGEVHALRRPLGWLERLVYRLGGVRLAEQAWPQYCASLLAFSALSLLVTYAFLRLQHRAAAEPAAAGPGRAPDLAFNTAASFTTNTNWQSYSGEAAMSYLSQMAALAWHNFISAAAGLAVAMALVRGLTRRREGTGKAQVPRPSATSG